MNSLSNTVASNEVKRKPEIQEQVQILQARLESLSDTINRCEQKLKPIVFIRGDQSQPDKAIPQVQRTELGKDLNNINDMLNHLINRLSMLSDSVEL